MSCHDPTRPDRMSHPRAPVGRLADLTPVQAWCIVTLRQWMDGPAGQSVAQDALAGRAGQGAAAHLLDLFDTLTDMLMTHARRRMTRRHTGCACVGSDEAAFAQLVETAATGDREDALMLAMLMVRADVAPATVALAQRLGLGLLRCGAIPGDRACVHHWPDRRGRLH